MGEEAASAEYTPPLGARFSQLYLERGSPQQDSPRLRHRIAAFFKNELFGYTRGAQLEIESGIGTEFQFTGYAYSVAEYLRKCPPEDFRDSITIIHRAIARAYSEDRYTTHQKSMDRWRTFCRDVFVEENVAFRVDGHCIVRPFVDEEFSRAATTLLRGMNDPRLLAVRVEVERAVADLGGREPDYKGAVRSIFEALEIYAKLAVTSCQVQRLNRNIVNEHLVQAILAQPEYGGPAAKSAASVGEALINWLDACHVYRHGQGVNEPSPPPPDLAVALVSAGLGHLRFFLDAVPLRSA